METLMPRAALTGVRLPLAEGLVCRARGGFLPVSAALAAAAGGQGPAGAADRTSARGVRSVAVPG